MHVSHERLLSSEMVAFMQAKDIWDKMRPRLTAEGVVAALDEAGIDMGVIFPLTFWPPDGHWQALNDMTAEYVQAYPDRLVGLAVLNPRDPGACVRELARAAGGLGLRGAKLHPSMQEFYPNDTALFPIYEFLAARGLPLLCHTGASVPDHPDKFSHPLHLDEVMVHFPALKLIMAHTGRPWYMDAAMVMRKHPNAHGDIVANVGRTGGTALMERMLIDIKLYADGLKRILFGSDFPVYEPSEMLAHLRGAAENRLAGRLGLPGVSPEELAGMLGGNAAGLFEITIGE
jgi:hypothetical protein